MLDNEKLKLLGTVFRKEEKIEIVKSLSDERKYLLLEKNKWDLKTKCEIICSFDDDNIKIEFLWKHINLLRSDEISVGKIIESMNSDTNKLQMTNKFLHPNNKKDNYTKRCIRSNIIASVKSKKLNLELLELTIYDKENEITPKFLINDKVTARVIKNLDDDELRFKMLCYFITKTSDKEAINYYIDVLYSFDDDKLRIKAYNFILENLNELNFSKEYLKETLIASLNDDQIKIEYLNNNNSSKVVSSLNDDELKLEYLKNLVTEDEKAKVITSLNDYEKQLELLPQIKKSKNRTLVICNLGNIEIKNNIYYEDQKYLDNWIQKNIHSHRKKKAINQATLRYTNKCLLYKFISTLTRKTPFRKGIFDYKSIEEIENMYINKKRAKVKKHI